MDEYDRFHGFLIFFAVQTLKAAWVNSHVNGHLLLKVGSSYIIYHHHKNALVSPSITYIKHQV